MTADNEFDRFARFYDADYRNYDDDLDLITQLAGEYGEPLLELGCGTGRVLLPLAQRGYRVTGVDISPALLDIARAKLTGATFAGRISLVEDDLRTFELDERAFRFAFCTSNTLMHLTTQADQLLVLQNARRHLAPDGRLLLDLFNPDVARLLAVDGLQELADRWVDERTGAEVVKWSVRSLDFAEQRQETLFIYEEFFSDGRVRRTLCPFTLRFLWQSELTLLLRLAGFAIEAVLGDFDGEPYHGASERLIVLARKALEKPISGISSSIFNPASEVSDGGH